MHTHTKTSLALAALALTASAHADVYTGQGGSIADNNSAGSDFTITVDDSMIVSDLSVTLTNFRHSFIGDLVATLTHEPTGRSITLFDRVGRVTTSSSSDGDSSNLHGNYAFADGGSNLWAAAAAGNNGTKIASGTYEATGSGIGANASTGPGSVSFASTFDGIDAHGDWVLNLSDRSTGDRLNNDWTWSMDFVAAVPGPGPLALLATAGAICGLRRRRNLPAA